jgi:Spy/CpxP family protein refolding chaperone
MPAAAAVALILPVGALAQQAPPATVAPGAQQWQGHRHRGGFMRMFRNLNLSDQQKSQIRTIMQQYRQAHPQGSQPDPQARKQMRDQIMNLLTPQQRTQFQQEMQQMRAQHEREHEQEQEQPQPQATPDV